jgi:hypothetical protein
MQLLLDEYYQIYVWVDINDENVELSPHFDHKEDALQWKAIMISKICKHNDKDLV